MVSIPTKDNKELYFIQKGMGQPIILIHGTAISESGNFKLTNLHNIIMLFHIADDMLTQTKGLAMVMTTPYQTMLLT